MNYQNELELTQKLVKNLYSLKEEVRTATNLNQEFQIDVIRTLESASFEILNSLENFKLISYKVQT